MAVSGAQPNPSGIAFHFTSASRADSLFSRSMDVPTRHAATGQDTPEWHSESRAQPRSKCCLHPTRRVATALMVDPAWAGSAPRSGMDTKKRSCGGQAIAVPGKIAAGTSMQVPFRGPASAVSARRGFRRAGWGRRQARDAITRWQCRAREQRAGALPDNRVRAVVARAGRRACRHFTAAWGPSAQRTVSLLQAAGSCGCGPAYRTTAPPQTGCRPQPCLVRRVAGHGNLRPAPHSFSSRPGAGANNQPGCIASGDGLVTFHRCMAAPPWARSMPADGRPPASSAGARWPGSSPPE